MNSQNDVRRELAAVAEQIANARAAMTRDELIDIAGIPERVRSVAGAITVATPFDPLVADSVDGHPPGRLTVTLTVAPLTGAPPRVTVVVIAMLVEPHLGRL